MTQFVVPTEVRNVLNGWGQTRKQQEELKRSQIAVDGHDTQETRGDLPAKSDIYQETAVSNREERRLNEQLLVTAKQSESQLLAPHSTVPPLPISRQKKAEQKPKKPERPGTKLKKPELPEMKPKKLELPEAKNKKLTQVGRKPQEMQGLGRAGSKSGILSWQSEAASKGEEIPTIPPSRSRKSDVSSHLSSSFNEYNELRRKGESHSDALSKTATYARTVLRDPRRQELDMDLFNTDKVLTSATLSKERELEEKLALLFKSISSGTKEQVSVKAERAPLRNRNSIKTRSRSWKRDLM